MTTAIYPGTFDPITNGHLDLIERALTLFDRIVVAVALSHDKEPLFTEEERVEMIHESLAADWPVGVAAFEGLLVDFCRAQGAKVVIRGLRAVADFEYEFQMALMNKHLAPEVEVVFLVPDVSYTFLSSSLVREVASLGADVSQFVTPAVLKRLTARLAGGADG